MPQPSLKIFIDSSLFSSFIDRADPNHLKAVSIFEYIGRENYKVFTTGLVIMQSYTRMERDLGSTIANDFLNAILESDIQKLYVTEAEMMAAYRFFKTNSSRQISLYEMLNATLMEKNGITTILTFDFWHDLMGTRVSNILTNIRSL